MVGINPLGIKDEMVVLVQVITCAQSKGQPKIIMEEIEQAPTKKLKQKYWRERQAKMATKKKKRRRRNNIKKIGAQKPPLPPTPQKIKEVQYWRDKLFEPLDTFLMAYESQ